MHDILISHTPCMFTHRKTLTKCDSVSFVVRCHFSRDWYKHRNCSSLLLIYFIRSHFSFFHPVSFACVHTISIFGADACAVLFFFPFVTILHAPRHGIHQIICICLYVYKQNVYLSHMPMCISLSWQYLCARFSYVFFIWTYFCHILSLKCIFFILLLSFSILSHSIEHSYGFCHHFFFHFVWECMYMCCFVYAIIAIFVRRTVFFRTKCVVLRALMCIYYVFKSPFQWSVFLCCYCCCCCCLFACFYSFVPALCEANLIQIVKSSPNIAMRSLNTFIRMVYYCYCVKHIYCIHSAMFFLFIFFSLFLGLLSVSFFF